MTEENKEIETADMTDNKKRKIAGLKQSLQSIFGASKQRTLQAADYKYRRSLTILLLFISIFCCACGNKEKDETNVGLKPNLAY